MARASAPPSPLRSMVSATLTTSRAADPLRFSDYRLRFHWGWDDTGQSFPCLSRQRLFAVSLCLVGQIRCKVPVGSRLQVDPIVVPPYGETCTALYLSQLIHLPETVERVACGRVSHPPPY